MRAAGAELLVRHEPAMFLSPKHRITDRTCTICIWNVESPWLLSSTTTSTWPMFLGPGGKQRERNKGCAPAGGWRGKKARTTLCQLRKVPLQPGCLCGRPT